MQTTRRGFLKSTAAGISSAFLLPSIQFDFGISPELVKKFCDPDIERYSLSEPFIQSDFCYATDGRAALRLLDAERYAGDSAGKLPDMEREFVKRGSTSSRGWRDWPEANYEIGKWGHCIYCRNRWKECGECLGCGMIDPDRMCETCEGEGDIRIECEKCRGLRHYDLPNRQKLDSRAIAPQYHHLISQLPNVRYLPGDTEECVTFRFDGGSGLLMPLRK